MSCSARSEVPTVQTPCFFSFSMVRVRLVTRITGTDSVAPQET